MIKIQAGYVHSVLCAQPHEHDALLLVCWNVEHTVSQHTCRDHNSSEPQAKRSIRAYSGPSVEPYQDKLSCTEIYS
jgi:hypothetical protein